MGYKYLVIIVFRKKFEDEILVVRLETKQPDKKIRYKETLYRSLHLEYSAHLLRKSLTLSFCVASIRLIRLAFGPISLRRACYVNS